MEYIKTKYKIKFNNSKDIIIDDNRELINILAKDIPIIFLEKQYKKNNKPKSDIWQFKTCQCMEGFTCKILYISEHFYYWIRENFGYFKKKKI